MSLLTEERIAELAGCPVNCDCGDCPALLGIRDVVREAGEAAARVAADVFRKANENADGTWGQECDLLMVAETIESTIRGTLT